MVIELSAMEVRREGIKATALVIHSRTQAKSIRLYRARSGASNGIHYVCMRFMVVGLIAIGKSGKGSKSIALAIRSHTRVNLIRPDRARLGGFNGALCV